VIEHDVVVDHREVGDGVDIDDEAECGGEEETVMALRAGQRVVAAEAVDDVVAGIAGDDVVDVVARAVDGSPAAKVEVLQFLAGEIEVDGTVDRVGALAVELDRPVAGIVDPVGVVADAALPGMALPVTIGDFVFDDANLTPSTMEDLKPVA
jgi:hypothetical protein